MKNFGRITKDIIIKKCLYGIVLGSLWMIVNCTGCGSTVSKMSKEDFVRFNQVTSVRAIHYDPAMSFRALTPSSALLGGGGAIGGLITLGLTNSAGNKLVSAYEIDDPVLLIKDEFLKSFSLGLNGKGVVSEAKSFPSASLAEIKKTYGDGWCIDFMTINWGMSYFATDWTHYRINYIAQGRLIDIGSEKVFWFGNCTYEPDDGKSPTYDELMANKGELLKAMLKRAAEKCAQDLWRSFQEEGISASK